MASGLLGWPPNIFWKSTPHEFFASLEERTKSNSPNDKSEGEEDFAQFRAKLERANVI
ncbi:phage tail assembly chaperone [Kiloniella antarctica]|uniref:Phage tail assembly chaperone n=1 Tax=Kiloniella antarctica TaxID=1550907 RepID=A0ABW5BP35_9PROT